MSDTVKLINVDKLKEQLDAWAVVINKPQFYSREDALHIIDTMPTIEMRRGKWVGKKFKFIPLLNTCPNCLYQCWGKKRRSSFCPNCGTDMREDSGR